jgi:hypothetical protein
LDKIVSFLFQVELLQNGKERFWVEVQEPYQKLLVGEKPNNIKDVAMPFKHTELSLGESFALQI